MFYWDWKPSQRWTVVLAMVGVSALPGIWFGLLSNWRALVGSVAFLTIPQIVGFLLFVGLKTGVMPQRGRRVSKAESPIEFWITGGLYVALLVLYFGGIAWAWWSGRSYQA